MIPAEELRQKIEAHQADKGCTEILELALFALLAKEALDKANLRFMAMGNSTIENGAPTAQELISMCEESAVRVQAALAKFPKEKP